MAKQVFQCEECLKTFNNELSADRCNAEHTLEGLADLMHKKLCRLDHTERCGYLYESWISRGGARHRWLQKARELAEFAAMYNIEKDSLLTFVIRMHD